MSIEGQFTFANSVQVPQNKRISRGFLIKQKDFHERCTRLPCNDLALVRDEINIRQHEESNAHLDLTLVVK